MLRQLKVTINFPRSFLQRNSSDTANNQLYKLNDSTLFPVQTITTGFHCLSTLQDRWKYAELIYIPFTRI